MNKMLVWSIAILMAISLASTAPKSPDHDDSMQKLCTHYGGDYKDPADDGFTGPTCSLVFKMFTKTQVEANELCSLYAPWRLVEATNGTETKCVVEATLRCEVGWAQMFGHCYQLFEKKKYTQQDAQTQCSSIQNSRIARIPHRYAVGVWKRFFPKISQVWMDPSEAFDPYIVEVTPGSNATAMAFTGKHHKFLVKANSLVRINKEWKLQALCEYEPPKTLAEIRKVAERYSEIYYPSIRIESGMLIRSASFYTRPDEKSKSHHSICQGIIKALRADDVVEFHPDKDSLNELDSFKSVSFSRSAGVALLDLFKMKTLMCDTETEVYEVPASRKEYANYRLDFSGSPKEPAHSCDNIRSTAIMLKQKGSKKAMLRSMSDSQPGPLLCKFGFTKQYTYNAPPGSVVFIRKDGVAVAHKFENEAKSWDDAQAHCKSAGGLLSGFDSYEEMMSMLDGMPNTRVTVGVYLGAKRNPKCSVAFSTDENDMCARKRVLQWQEGVAANDIESSWWLNDNHNVLNPTNPSQKCMTMYREQDAPWAEKGQTGRLDDDQSELCRATYHVPQSGEKGYWKRRTRSPKRPAPEPDV